MTKLYKAGTVLYAILPEAEHSLRSEHGSPCIAKLRGSRLFEHNFTSL